ncbi:hypothetical protein RJ639_001541 [Escallonia herrerae]|uniref:MOM1 alpha-helical domain-containing protein n=1 Tax=Escallonia herrerae TaxID=1293975 RepID=A0AA88X9K4_9ASTE|nr:hypothetical protein RJ639_001541 [Escallonia herrerae]
MSIGGSLIRKTIAAEMMVNDSRSRRKSRDFETNSSKKKLSNGKGSSASGSGTGDTSSIRRSTRETPSKKQMTPSPSSTRKSERLEKLTPVSPPKKMKSERQGVPSPLRRSDRGKIQTSSSSSSLKNSGSGPGSSAMKQKKGGTEKGVKQSTVETRQVRRSENHNLEIVGGKAKRMDGHTFKAFFKIQRTMDTASDNDEVLERPDKLSQVDSSSGAGNGSMQVEDRHDEGDECSGRAGEELRNGCERASDGAIGRSSAYKKLDMEAPGICVEIQLSSSSRKHRSAEESCRPSDGDEETLGDSEAVLVGRSAENNWQTPELKFAASVGKSPESDIDQGSGDRCLQYKRKRSTTDMDSSPSSGCKGQDVSETGVSCSKRSRGDDDNQKQDVCNTTLNKEFCGTSHNEDRVGLEHCAATENCDGNTQQEKLSQDVAYDCKSDSSRFLEFWVPVQLSNVQLEQYCTTLLSNSIPLCSCSKNDPVGALRDILISTRKCCDHPYIVDPPLQSLITKGLPEVEYLDVGIQASGKLQLLDIILSEIRSRKLRVLILFQSIGGSGRDSIGDILDDFLRQRFGPDSYERVDGCLIPSKKQAALNKFNDKKSGRKESLALAKQHLDFSCKEEEANHVYSRLRLLKRMFLTRTKKNKESEDAEELPKEPLDVTHEQAPNYEMPMEEVPQSVKRVRKKCEKRMKRLQQQHQEEVQEFHRIWEEKRTQLKKEHRVESALVRSIHSHLRIDKLKILDNEYTEKMEEHKRQKDMSLKDLEAKQLVAINDERQKASHLLLEAKSSISEDRAHCSKSENQAKYTPASDHEAFKDPDKVVPVPKHVVEAAAPDGRVHNMIMGSSSPADTPVNLANGVGSCTETVLVSPTSKNDRLETAASKTSGPMFEERNRVGSLTNGCDTIVSSSPHNSDMQLFDGIQGEETVVDEVVGVIASVETDTPAIESCGYNDAGTTIGFKPHDAAETQNAGRNNSISCNSVPLVEAVVSPACYHSLPENLPSTSTSLRRGHSQPHITPASGLADEPHSPSQNVETSSQLVVQAAGLSDPTVSQTGERPLENNLPDILSAGRILNRPSSRLRSSSQNADLPQAVQDSAEPLNHALLQSGVNITSVQGLSNVPLHSELQGTFRTLTLPMYADPLQNEMERIRKETEQTIKIHEDTKVRLKSECEKELEAMIAQIRSKYEAQLQNIEAAFVLRKNELEANQNKVLMNKILADAFRSKCLDLRPSGALGTQQVMPPSFLQQLQQVQAQPALRTSGFSGSSLAGQPATSHQITPLPLHIVHQSAAVASTLASQPASTLHIAAPPLQIVHQSAALFSSTPSRPPSINPMTPFSSTASRPHNIDPLTPISSSPARPPSINPINLSTGNLRVGAEIRAPAPHLQPFRRVVPSQQALGTLPTTSSSLHLPLPLPRPPLSTPPPPTPTNHSSLNRQPQPETAGALPVNNSSALSALELLMDMDNRQNTPRPNILPLPPNVASTFQQLDLSEFGIGSGIRVSSAPLVAETDVVCLSDDD